MHMCTGVCWYLCVSVTCVSVSRTHTCTDAPPQPAWPRRALPAARSACVGEVFWRFRSASLCQYRSTVYFCGSLAVEQQSLTAFQSYANPVHLKKRTNNCIHKPRLIILQNFFLLLLAETEIVCVHLSLVPLFVFLFFLKLSAVAYIILYTHSDSHKHTHESIFLQFLDPKHFKQWASSPLEGLSGDD